MSMFNKMKSKLFWINVVKVAFPFFIFVTIISLFMNSWRDIFAGDFTTVAETNFTDGKWLSFWLYKVVFSFLYGIYMTNKNMK